MLLVATEDKKNIKKNKNSSVKISGKKLQPDMDKNSQHRRRLMEGSARLRPGGHHKQSL